MRITSSTRSRAIGYAALCGAMVSVGRRLGEGTDGEVFETNRTTVIKAFKYDVVYFNERDTYLHLRDFGCTEKIGEFQVPSLWGFSDEFYVVEMDYMFDAPYVIDFGKVRLFRDPEFSDEIKTAADIQGSEQFGGNWSRVKQLLADLESYGIYYLDPNPRNIVFPGALGNS